MVNGREKQGSRRWDRQETGHSQRKNKVGTTQYTNLECRSEGKNTCSRARRFNSHPVHLARSSENQLNVLRNPRYGGTVGRGQSRHAEVFEKRNKLAKPSGGVRIWGYPIDCGRANNSGHSNSQCACGFIESHPRTWSTIIRRCGSTSKHGSKKDRRREG